MDDDQPTVEMPPMVTADGIANTLIFDRIFLGELAEIPRVRASLHDWLNGSPVTDDVELIATELAANAVVHSASKGLYFTVRAYRHSGHLSIEVEDIGSPWRVRAMDGRPHGLDLVALLAEWGTEVRGCDGRRTVWARLSTTTQTPDEPRRGCHGPGAHEGQEVNRSA